jgi:hypothetical protein
MPHHGTPDSITLEEIRKLLPPKEYKEFSEWMRGQTAPSQHSVYKYDFDRWLRWKRGGPEPAFD